MIAVEIYPCNCGGCADPRYDAAADRAAASTRSGEIVKQCVCGLQHTRAGFDMLPLTGRQIMDGRALELRRCSCNSTLALVIEPRRSR